MPESRLWVYNAENCSGGWWLVATDEDAFSKVVDVVADLTDGVEESFGYNSVTVKSLATT